MGAFDDLVPSSKPAAPAASGGGAFDDLIPQAAPKGPGILSRVAQLFQGATEGVPPSTEFDTGMGEYQPPEPPSVMNGSDGMQPGPMTPATAALARQVDRVAPTDISRNPAEPTVAPVRGAAPTIGNMAADLGGAIPNQASQMKQGARALFADVMGYDSMRDDALKRGGQAQLEDATTNPAIEDPTLAAIYGGVKSTVQQVPGLALGAVGGVPAALTALGFQQGLPKYGELRNDGVAPLPAFGNAAAQGTIEAGTEMLALDKLGKFIKAPGARKLLVYALNELGGEQIATLGENLFDALGSKDPNAIQRYKDQIGEQAYSTLISTLTQTALMGGAGKVANKLLPEQPAAPTYRDLVEAFGFKGAPNAGTVQSDQGQLPAPGQAVRSGGEAGGNDLQRAPAAGIGADGAEVRGTPGGAQPQSGVAGLLAAIQQAVPEQQDGPRDRVPGPADLVDVRAEPDHGQPSQAPAGNNRPGEERAAAQAEPDRQGPGEQVRAVPGGDTADQALTQNGPVLQNRDRSSAASIRQMNAIAANPDPQRLSFSREFATGAPVVYSNGDAAKIPAGQVGRQETITDANGKKYTVQYAVLPADQVLTSNRADGTPVKMYGLDNAGLIKTVAGNARMAGLQAAYERGTTGPYVEGIKADAALHGVDAAAIDAIENPVLVRIMRSADVTGNIGDVSNQSGVSALNATEQAQTDAARVDFGALEFDDNGLPTHQSVMSFIRNMPEAEQGGLLVGKGQPAKQASERLMAATFARAYGDPALVELYAQATDPEAKIVLAGLAQAAGPMAKLEDVEGQLDFRPFVVQAARLAVNAARQGVSISKLAKQADFETPPEAQQLLEFFATNSRSARKIGDGLRNAAEFAYTEGTKSGTDMFGAVERATPAQVLGKVNETAETKQSALALGESAGPAPYANDAARPNGRRGAGQVPADNRQAEGRPESQTGVAERDRSDKYTQDLDLAAPAGAADAGRQRGPAGREGPADRLPGPPRTVSTVVAKPIEGAQKPRPRVIHKSIADQFEQAGVGALVGQQIPTNDNKAAAEAVAQMAQVYRDPRYETFRIIMVKGGKVVHETAVTSRKPSATSFVPANVRPGEMARNIQHEMKRVGATGYWLMHNHPSGSPSASDADLELTRHFMRTIPGFEGHVIINSGKFGYIAPQDVTSPFNSQTFKLSNYPGDAILNRPDAPSWMGSSAISPREVAVLAKGLQHPGHVAVIGATGGYVRSAAEFPSGLLKDPTKAAAWFRRLGITGGGGVDLFLYVNNASVLADYGETIDQLWQAGYITDLVEGNGRSVTGISPKRGQYGKDTHGSAREVREDLPAYEDQTPDTQKLWHKGDENLPTLGELTPAQRAIYDSIGRAPTEGKFALKTQAERDIEERAAIKIAVRGWDAIEAEYDKLPETEGGVVMNVDTARELFNDYLADRTQAAAVHEPSSTLVKELFKRKLARGPGEGRQALVLFTAGGTGAGKSTGFKQFQDAGQLKDTAALVYDTNVANAKKGIEKMQQAMDAGYAVYLMHTVRDPVEALTAGALTRAEGQAEKFGSGRTVPLAEHVKTHVEANQAVPQVVEHFKSNGMFGYSIVDNRHGKGNAVYIELSEIPRYQYDQIEPAARQALEQAYETGQISEATYRGFAGAQADASPGAANVRQDKGGVPAALQRERQKGRSDQLGSGTPQAKQPQAAAEKLAPYGRQVDAPAFRKWFGKSQVVDADGNPMPVYHGTDADFEAFDTTDFGAWFAERPKKANDYVNRSQTKGGPPGYLKELGGEKVLKVYLRIEKPLRIPQNIDMSEDNLNVRETLKFINEANGTDISAKEIGFPADYEGIHFEWLAEPGFIDALKKRGFDGMFAYEKGERTWNVFSPEQAKSATGNRGTFSNASPKIVEEELSPYEQDLTDQAKWLTEQAKKAGHADLDALVKKDPQKFIELAGQWRATHVAEDISNYGPQPFIDPVTGRLKAGERAYAALDKYVGGLLRKVGLASNTSPEFRRLMQRYRADQSKAKAAAVNILESGKDLPPAERALMSDFIENEMAAGVTAPEHIQLIAQQIDAAINRQTQQLVDLGLITEQQAKHWQGRYLPRYYSKDVDEQGNVIPLWKRALRVGIKAKHSKSRGLLEIVPKSMVNHMKAAGFTELKDADTQDPNLVAMWRDFTKAEREKMGEERDAIYRFARGVMETGGDIAAARVFKSIANSKLATSSKVVGDQRGWKQVPTVSIPGTQAKRFGALSGMYVPEEVWKELEYTFRDRGAFEKGFAELMALWKEGKTAMNPATHAANVMSNVLMADIAGISPLNVKAYAKALADFRKQGKMTREAIEQGLLEGNAVDELREWLPDSTDVLRHEGPAGIGALFETRAAQLIGKYTGASWYRKHMRNLYGAEDAFFKLLIFSHYRGRGMDAEAAAAEANRYIFDYRDLPPNVQRIRNFAIPFVSYTYKAIPAITHAWLTRPWVMAKYALIFSGINALSYALGGDDDEDYERRMMPAYMKGWSPLGFPSHIRVMDDRDGNPQFLNIGRLTPLGTLFNSTNGEGLPLPQAFMPSHPLLQAYLTLGWNVDPLTGGDFFKASDDAQDRTLKSAKYVFQQFAPAMPLLPGTYGFDKLAQGVAGTFNAPVEVPELGINWTGQGRFGQEESVPRAVGQTVFGVNVRGFSVDKQERGQRGKVMAEIREVQGNIRQIMRDQTLGEQTKAARLEHERGKIERLREQLQGAE
jgi:proteasome lid subunit RPN8/RPN11